MESLEKNIANDLRVKAILAERFKKAAINRQNTLRKARFIEIENLLTTFSNIKGKAYPNQIEFVTSLEYQFERTKDLSDKQVESLKKVVNTVKKFKEVSVPQNDPKLERLLNALLDKQEEVVCSSKRFNGVSIKNIYHVFKVFGVEPKVFF